MRKLLIILFVTAISRQIIAGPQYANIKYSIVTVDFSKLDYKTINVGDGTSSDWTGILPVIENTETYSSNEYIWYDAYGDDVGDGDYTYPTNSGFGDHSADIEQFRVCWDSTNIYLYIRNYNAPSVWWRTCAIIGIDTGTPYEGSYDFIEGDGIDPEKGPAGELRCEKIKMDYFLFTSSTYKARLWNSAGIKIGDNKQSTDDGSLDNFYYRDAGWEVYEISIPQGLIGIPSTTPWNFIVGVGFEEDTMFREIQPPNSGVPMEWYGIGGDSAWWDNTSPDPDVFDLIGASFDKQVQDLSSYSWIFTESQSNLESLNAGITPNLFKSEYQKTFIYFSVPFSCNIKINILKLDGSNVFTLFNNNLPAQPGNELYEIEWDGRNLNGAVLDEAVYILHFQYIANSQTRDVYKYFKIYK